MTIVGSAGKDLTQATIKVTPLPRAIAGEVYEIVISGTLKIGKEDVVRSTVVPIKIIETKVEKKEKTEKSK